MAFIAGIVGREDVSNGDTQECRIDSRRMFFPVYPVYPCFVLMKRAERARVRASGSTATSAPAWRLRLEKSPPGYKKFNGNPEAVSCQQRRPIASPGGSQKGNAGCFQARWLGRWKVI